ncbi:hypothetical protein F4809DRAFT_596098 [Biscogniauxia mediterranea]|nr:hypothetical protein F4809DRAFT_596098 [Biscogniauxia mediterranea]
MSQLNTELRSTSPSSTSPSTSQSSSSWFSSAPDPAGAPGPLDPLSESLLPRKMSCQQSFDQAFYCNSFGGQWMSVYRTGAARSCSEYWSEFWFCMRARSMRGEARANTVRDYYRRREVARYGPGRPSSTDVWEPRTERLPPGEAFSQPYVAPEVDDEEWRRLEIQRRRMVREYLDREAQQEKEEREKKRAARAARIKAKQEAAAAAATAEPK